MKVLGKTADECVAVEDSKSGATAAYRANIKTIVSPSPPFFFPFSSLDFSSFY
jgi:beta-phosphoglucomutase-like phosphatase (HAD superfamily)